MGGSRGHGCPRCKQQCRDTAKRVDGGQQPDAARQAQRRQNYERASQGSHDCAERIGRVNRPHAAAIPRQGRDESFHRGQCRAHRRRRGQQHEKRQDESDRPMAQRRRFQTDETQRRLVRERDQRR